MLNPQHSPQALLQVSATPSKAQFREGFLPAQPHLLFLLVPLMSTVNFNGESAQVEHVPQAAGQVSETPS